MPSKTDPTERRETPRVPTADARRQFVQGILGALRALSVVVRAVTALAALVLALHVVFTLFSGNADNSIVETVGDYAHDLAGPLRDLFSFKTEKTNVFVNYGVAAVLWLLAGRVVANLLTRGQAERSGS